MSVGSAVDQRARHLDVVLGGEAAGEVLERHRHRLRVG